MLDHDDLRRLDFEPVDDRLPIRRAGCYEGVPIGVHADHAGLRIHTIIRILILAVNQELHTIFRIAGFSKILFGLLPKDSQDYENAFIVGNYPAAWREHYDRAGYARVDPTVSHCTQSVLPIFWEPSIYQTRKQHEFFEEASAAGLVYGLTMPLHGARGELGALSLSVEAENRAEANRFMESVLPTLWMLKDYALQSGAGLAFEHPVSKPVVLTSREKEVLQWCAIGKTSWEISVICNCSEANVNFHMGNIRRKFGVTSRRVAAIMAVNLGLITL
ncbi:LuxR family transcriptional regulator [Pseudomonas aeruginosa]